MRGVRRVTVATVFGALTTIIAFVPSLFLQEGFARAMSHVGTVVILCLIFSLIETKLILPAHLRHQKTGVARIQGDDWKHRALAVQQRAADSMKRFAGTYYRRTLERAVEQRYLSLALFLAALMLTLALLPAGLLRFVFFPTVPSDFIDVELHMPEGAAWKQTHEYGLHMERAARSVDERYRRHTGSADSVIRALLVSSASDIEVSMVLELVPNTERSMTSMAIANWLREEIGELDGIRSMSVDAVSGPQGAPIDIELSGGSIEQLQRAARELKSKLSVFDGVYDLRDSFNAGGPELDIRVSAEGEAQGLGQAELARQVRQAFFGAEVQRLQRGRHEVRVYVRLPAEQRRSLEALQSMWIRLPDGRKLPFGVVGEVHQQLGVGAINRFNSRRVVNVIGDVDKVRIEPGEVNRIIVEELLPPLMLKHTGIEARLAGEAEAQAKTGKTLVYGTIAILLMIYAALAIPLKSYLQPLIIMSVIPFGLLGALLGHLIFGREVNMLSVIGMLGLTGVVVNDSLVLVDCINQHIKAGLPWRDSVQTAGVERFRAVILTSVTTFVGLLPIQLENSIQANYVKPMAISVAFGVLFATAVTLLLVPSLYYIARDVRRLLFGTASEPAFGAASQSRVI